MTRTGGPAVADRLLATALDLFLEHGYNGTSLQMIADELGVTKAAIYYHYRTKDEILAALLTPAARALTDLLDEIESITPRQQPRQFIEHYVNVLLEHRGVVALGTKDATVMAHPAMREGSDAIRDRILDLLTGGTLTLEAGVQFAAALGALQAVVTAYPDSPREDLRPLMVDIARTLLRSRPG